LKGRVIWLRTLIALVVLESLESLEAGSTSDQLVGQLALMLLLVVTVDLTVSVLRVVYGRNVSHTVSVI
jgi:hypothetical protein